MSSDEIFLKTLRAAFLEEAHEQLENIASGLMKLQTSFDENERKTLVETIYREFHNLKGSARAVNLTHLESTCQSLESVFALVKRGDKRLTTRLIGHLLDATDTISGTMNSFETAQEFKEFASLAKIFEQLDIADAADLELSESVDRSPAQPTESTITSKITETNRDAIRIPANRLDELLMRAEDMLSLKVITRQNSQDLQNLDYKFSPYGREWTKAYNDLRSARELIRQSELSPDNIYIGNVLTRVIDFLDWQQAQLSALNLEIVGIKKRSTANYKLATTAVDSFLEDAKRLLMMPVATLLEMVPKMVRDLGRELGKEVEVQINGTEIMLDKRVLQQVKDPIIHILRNCIDHGIESPSERLQNGKSSHGAITVSVTQHESSVVEISIGDDGAGINTEKLVEAAIKGNLYQADELKRFTEEQLINLIFESSLSTSASVSEISGRGLGMAIARDNIQKIGGRLTVQTRLGAGSIFRIFLPVTVATFRGVIIRCGGETIVVPTAEVDHVAKIKRVDIRQSEQGQQIRVNGHLVPLIRLDQILDLPQAQARDPGQELVLIVHSSKQTMALIIDEVLEEQEVLVKRFEKPIIRTRNLAGLTILGTGRPAAILNMADVIKSGEKLLKANLTAATTSSAVQLQKRILVVDDTITARMLMRTILESAGYSVKTANDGLEALAILKANRFDIVLSDIEMPKMTGLELTEKIKSDPSLSSIPVVLITSMTDSSFRKLGEQAGADAFFIKSSFDQRNLLDVLKNLI